jgi:hypothetical protein
MVGGELTGVFQASRFDNLLQGLQGLVVKVVDALGFVWYDQGLLSSQILCRYTGWTITRMTSLGLQASQGKHESSGTVAPVCAQGHQQGNIECTDDLTRTAHLDCIAKACTHQRVMH